MVVDTSAVIAVLQREPSGERIRVVLREQAHLALSVVSFVEASNIIQHRSGDAGVVELDALVDRLGVELVPVTVDQGRLAREAFRMFGKGRHPAALNFGDCFSYALARTRNEPLLYVGGDFARTDVRPGAY